MSIDDTDKKRVTVTEYPVTMQVTGKVVFNALGEMVTCHVRDVLIGKTINQPLSPTQEKWLEEHAATVATMLAGQMVKNAGEAVTNYVAKRALAERDAEKKDSPANGA